MLGTEKNTTSHSNLSFCITVSLTDTLSLAIVEMPLQSLTLEDGIITSLALRNHPTAEEISIEKQLASQKLLTLKINMSAYLSTL